MAVRKFSKPWVMKQGVNNRFVLRLLNTNITGYEFRTDLRYKASDASPIITLTNGSGFTILDGAEGLLEINFSPSILAAVQVPDGEVEFPFVNVLFDIEFNDGSSPAEWEALAMGMARVLKGITTSNG